MKIRDYKYTVEQCDVPEVRRASLSEYRVFRYKCLDYLRGEAPTSVMNQVHNLTWHTAVFRTLNEARRLEPDRPVNGAFWELTTAGYANLMTLGIRRLVDRDPRTNSIWNVIAQIEKRPELLTREHFICHDGLPYDPAPGERKYVESIPADGVHMSWMPTTGPDAWASSQLMHQAFDNLAGRPSKRKRLDKVKPSILEDLKAKLASPAIQSVCTLADRRIAHAERLAKTADPLPAVTYNDIDQALAQLVQVADYLLSKFFYDVTFGSVVPTPQFDVLEALDQPWVGSERLEALHQEWQQICSTMNHWTHDPESDFPKSSPE